jgi:transcription initiation factor TFIID subunit 2
MPGLVETPTPAPGAQAAPGLGYSVLHQTVELDIDILRRSLKGKTSITISPHSADLTKIRLNCRQCELKRANVNGISPTLTSTDPYKGLKYHKQATILQHSLFARKVEHLLKSPPEEELVVNLPKNVKIQEQDIFAQASMAALASGGVGFMGERASTRETVALDSALPLKTSDPSTGKFEPLVINLEYVIDDIRDGLHFAGLEDSDGKYPHVYTRNSMFPGSACCLFPCVDSISSRCTWDISIKCHRTLGDAMKRTIVVSEKEANGTMVNGGVKRQPIEVDDYSGLSPEDRELEMVVICSGDLTDEVAMRHPPLSNV